MIRDDEMVNDFEAFVELKTASSMKFEENVSYLVISFVNGSLIFAVIHIHPHLAS